MSARIGGGNGRDPRRRSGRDDECGAIANGADELGLHKLFDDDILGTKATSNGDLIASASAGRCDAADLGGQCPSDRLIGEQPGDD